MSLVQADKLEKNYQSGDIIVPAIRGVSFSIEKSSFVSFVGPSGSGKSTLLNMIGCLDRPTSGYLSVLGVDVGQLDRVSSAIFRGKNIGFIFQDFNLIPILSVYENIEYPLLILHNWSKEKRYQRVMDLLEAVNMGDQADKRPDQLSGGQKQRVAVARALVTNAPLVLADEPTANLDQKTAYHIINLMHDMRNEFGTTFLFSTHDPKIMEAAEITYVLEDGLLHMEKNGGQNHV